VGVGNCPGEDNDLPFVDDDREAMVEYLRKECNVPNENIDALSDSNARVADINNAFTVVRSKITDEDEYLFYFSGHGDTSSGDSCICPYDSLPPYSFINSIDCDELDFYWAISIMLRTE